MEKVKVNKEVFDALEHWIEGYDKKLELVLDVIYEEYGFSSKEYLALNSLSVDEICKCLIIGYELEETPEEELARYYNMESENIMDDVFNSGIRCALNTLGIQIKGINSWTYLKMV